MRQFTNHSSVGSGYANVTRDVSSKRKQLIWRLLIYSAFLVASMPSLKKDKIFVWLISAFSFFML